MEDLSEDHSESIVFSNDSNNADRLKTRSIVYQKNDYLFHYFSLRNYL